MTLEELQHGRYRLQQLIGSGGMGEVYLAEDTRIHRHIAIKLIRAEATPYPAGDTLKDAVRLFEQEAKTIAIFNHPNILPLYDFGEEKNNGIPLTFMVMPYCQEGTLTTWLLQRSTSGSLPPETIVHFISQAASALQHAHDHGIVHRDVKPSNVLIRSNKDDPNRPDLMLADFGIARFAASTTNKSRTIRGTPTYMAPELWSGTPVPASDQYALAVMAYEMLTGRSPFQGSLEQLMYQHIHAQAPRPSELNPNIGTDVDDVLAIALSKRPENRFARLSAFAHALQNALLHTSANNEYTIVKVAPSLTARDAIHATLAISTTEAMYGTRRALTLPERQQVTVNLPAGTTNGQVFQLEGLSASSPSGGLIGRLLLTILVTDPGEPIHRQDASGTIPVVNVPGDTVRSTGSAPTIAVPPHTWLDGVNARRKGLSKGMTVLLIALALLLGAGSVAYFYPLLLAKNSASTNQTATLNAHATGMAQNNVNGTTQANATAQANSLATNAALQNPYTNNGTLVLNDPLNDNNKGNNWLTGKNQRGATCVFTGGAYYSTQPAQGFFHACPAENTDFSNFVFEAQMTFISGDYAGIIFCDATDNTYYLYRVGTDGSYSLLLFSQPNSDGTPLISGLISIDLYQTNVIAVVVNRGTIELYMNQQLIRSVNDSTYMHGRIAVFVWNASGNTAQARFSNAKVWAL